MRAFTVLEAPAVALERENVDTDAIFPGRHVLDMEPDYARALFADWRRGPDGAPRPGFALNHPDAAGAEILVAGANFGCGSSREQAVWALAAGGIRCVLAESFGDIFAGNAVLNGLLPARLAPEDAARLLSAVAAKPGLRLRVDLRACEVTGPDGMRAAFAVAEADRAMLLSGLDAIGATLRDQAAIAAFQSRDRLARPWVHDPTAA